MKIWLVEYTFKYGGPGGIRGEATRPTAFYNEEDAEAEVEYATKLHGSTTEYRAVAYVPEDSQ